MQRTIGALALMLLIPLLSVSASGRSEEPPAGLVNNIVQHTMAAADFSLTDQHGQPFHLADSRGKVVVLCFIYTHCTDICPFISVKVRDANQTPWRRFIQGGVRGGHDRSEARRSAGNRRVQ